MVHEVQETVEVESIDEEIAENQHVRIEVTSASDSDSLHLPEGDDDSEPEVPSGPRPKRLSDLNLKEKTIPMPNASSLFFLGTNNAFRKAAHKIGTRFVILRVGYMIIWGFRGSITVNLVWVGVFTSHMYTN